MFLDFHYAMKLRGNRRIRVLKDTPAGQPSGIPNLKRMYAKSTHYGALAESISKANPTAFQTFDQMRSLTFDTLPPKTLLFFSRRTNISPKRPDFRQIVEEALNEIKHAQ